MLLLKQSQNAHHNVAHKNQEAGIVPLLTSVQKSVLLPEMCFVKLSRRPWTLFWSNSYARHSSFATFKLSISAQWISLSYQAKVQKPHWVFPESFMHAFPFSSQSIIIYAIAQVVTTCQAIRLMVSGKRSLLVGSASGVCHAIGKTIPGTTSPIRSLSRTLPDVQLKVSVGGSCL